MTDGQLKQLHDMHEQQMQLSELYYSVYSKELASRGKDGETNTGAFNGAYAGVGVKLKELHRMMDEFQ